MHKILSSDPESMTGECSVCGPVKLKRKKNRLACRNSELRWKGRGRRSVSGRWFELKRSAKRRDLECTLSREQHEALLTQPCHYCTEPLNPTGSGLDRKDSAIGYTPENVVPCCVFCNKLKSNVLTYEEMQAAVKAIIAIRKAPTSL